MNKNYEEKTIFAIFIVLVSISAFSLMTLAVGADYIRFLKAEIEFEQKEYAFWQSLADDCQDLKDTTLLFGCIRGCEIEKGNLTIENHNECIIKCNKWLED